MSVTINGNGTIAGVSVGGLPDGIVDSDMLAANAVATAKIADDAVNSNKISNDLTVTNNLSVNNDLKVDSGFGSTTTIYGVRAWVTIDGTGSVNRRASGNVTSISDNGTGDYTVNFTNAFPDVNYCVACAIPVINDQGATYGWGVKHDNGGASSAPTTKTASACRLQARRESDYDIDFGHVMFVR